MSVTSDTRVVTPRGLVRIDQLCNGEHVLSGDAKFHKLRTRPHVSYVDTPIVRAGSLGITFAGRLMQASRYFYEVARMSKLSRVVGVSPADWERAINVTPRAELMAVGMVIDRGSFHIALGVSPVAILGRVLFASTANSEESPVTSLIEYRGHVWDLTVEDSNSYVAERYVVEGIAEERRA